MTAHLGEGGGPSHIARKIYTYALAATPRAGSDEVNERPPYQGKYAVRLKCGLALILYHRDVAMWQSSVSV